MLSSSHSHEYNKILSISNLSRILSILVSLLSRFALMMHSHSGRQMDSHSQDRCSPSDSQVPTPMVPSPLRTGILLTPRSTSPLSQRQEVYHITALLDSSHGSVPPTMSQNDSLTSIGHHPDLIQHSASRLPPISQKDRTTSTSPILELAKLLLLQEVSPMTGSLVSSDGMVRQIKSPNE